MVEVLESVFEIELERLVELGVEEKDSLSWVTYLEGGVLKWGNSVEEKVLTPICCKEGNETTLLTISRGKVDCCGEGCRLLDIREAKGKSKS